MNHTTVNTTLLNYTTAILCGLLLMAAFIFITPYISLLTGLSMPFDINSPIYVFMLITVPLAVFAHGIIAMIAVRRLPKYKLFFISNLFLALMPPLIFIAFPLLVLNQMTGVKEFALFMLLILFGPVCLLLLSLVSIVQSIQLIKHSNKEKMNNARN